MVAVRERDAGVGRYREGRRHAGNDLERHLRPAERLRLLRAAAEEEGIAVLQAHDGLPGARALHQQRLDGLLARPVAVVVRAAECDHLRPGADEVEQTRADQAVVHDDVGRCEAALAAPGEEARIAGPRSHQVDAPAHPPRISLAPATSNPSARARPSASASAAGAPPPPPTPPRPPRSGPRARGRARPAATVASAPTGGLQFAP